MLFRSPLVYTVTPGVHHHPWPTLSPLHTPSPRVYTVTPGLHCHPCIHRNPWRTLSRLEETASPGGGLSVLTDGWRSQTPWPARCRRTPSAVRPGTGQGRRRLDTPENAKHRVRHVAEPRVPTAEQEASRAAGRPWPSARSAPRLPHVPSTHGCPGYTHEFPRLTTMMALCSRHCQYPLLAKEDPKHREVMLS